MAKKRKKVSAVFLYTFITTEEFIFTDDQKKCASSIIYDFHWYFDFKKCIAKSTSTKLGIEQMLVIKFGVLDQDEVNIFFHDAKYNNIMLVLDFCFHTNILLIISTLYPKQKL